MEEKIKELETELDRVNAALRNSETENVQLKDQVKRMIEGEDNLRLQLKTLQESLEIISSKHKDLESVKDDTSYQVQEYEEKISELKAILNESSIAQSELEAEREALTGRVAEHERRTKATHETSLELKGLMQRSYSRVEDSNRRVSEFEKLLEAEKERISEFEREIETLEEKYDRAEAEKNKYSDLVTQLTAELEQSSGKVSSLENALEGANQKEKELRESLDATSEEKRRSEEALENTTEKLKDDEGLIGVLSNELNVTQGKLESTENDNKRNFDLKLQGLSESFKSKDTDMQSLYEKLELLKDQITAYKDQTTEAARKSDALKKELDKTLGTLGDLEASNEELKKLRDEAESKTAQSIMENEILVQTNAGLKNKVDELEQQLEAAGAEKGGGTRPSEQQSEDHESKLKNLQEELSATLAEKDDVVRQLNSSKKKNEDLTQGLSSESEKFQGENLVDKNVASQDDLPSLVSKLEGQVKEYQGMNELLRDELEKLTLEAAQNSARGTSAKDLEEKLKVVEADMHREVESVRASAAAREAELTSRLEQLMKKTQDDDAASEKKEESDKVASARESASKHVSEELEAKSQRVILLEEQVKELQQKLQEGGSLRSRGIEDTQANTIETPATHSSFKMVVGVAIASIIIGLVLGTNYLD